MLITGGVGWGKAGPAGIPVSFRAGLEAPHKFLPSFPSDDSKMWKNNSEITRVRLWRWGEKGVFVDFLPGGKDFTFLG
jgi:hypothetical protein